MIKKLPTFFILILFIPSAISQNKKALISGTIKNTYLKPIKGTHIVNLTTQKGAVSDNQGNFTLEVNEGDWLLISNVQYKQKRLRITSKTIEGKTIQIHLFAIVNELSEVVLKKKMTGILKKDRIEKEKDTLPKIDKDYYNFSKMDLSIKKVKILNDKSNAQYHTDPTMKNVATTIASIGIPDKTSAKKRALRKELDFKKQFPYKLKKELGEHFFFITLKIPKERYHHFLNYCNSFGIDQLYKNGKVLALMEILKKESKSYLLIINKD